jgi:hypothetical protein
MITWAMITWLSVTTFNRTVGTVWRTIHILSSEKPHCDMDPLSKSLSFLVSTAIAAAEGYLAYLIFQKIL